MIKKYLKWNFKRGLLENDFYLKYYIKYKKYINLKNIYIFLYLIKFNDNFLLKIILKNKKIKINKK